MQRDCGARNAAPGQRLEDFWREVKARRGRRNRAALTRIDRLIALAIACRVLALDIRRQRYVPDVVDRLLNARAVFGPEADRATAVEMPLENLTSQHMRGPAEQDFRAGLELLPGMDEGIPTSFAEIGKQKALNGPTARHSHAQKPGRKDSRVVHDEKIAFAQEPFQIGYVCVFDLPRALVQDEQPRCAALHGGRLRNQFSRQIETEIGDVHRTYCARKKVGRVRGVAREIGKKGGPPGRWRSAFDLSRTSTRPCGMPPPARHGSRTPHRLRPNRCFLPALIALHRPAPSHCVSPFSCFRANINGASVPRQPSTAASLP